MKKVISFILCLSLVLCLFGCGSETSTTKSNDVDNNDSTDVVEETTINEENEFVETNKLISQKFQQILITENYGTIYNGGHGSFIIDGDKEPIGISYYDENNQLVPANFSSVAVADGDDIYDYIVDVYYKFSFVDNNTMKIEKLFSDSLDQKVRALKTYNNYFYFLKVDNEEISLMRADKELGNIETVIDNYNNVLEWHIIENYLYYPSYINGKNALMGWELKKVNISEDMQNESLATVVVSDETSELTGFFVTQKHIYYITKDESGSLINRVDLDGKNNTEIAKTDNSIYTYTIDDKENNIYFIGYNELDYNFQKKNKDWIIYKLDLGSAKMEEISYGGDFVYAQGLGLCENYLYMWDYSGLVNDSVEERKHTAGVKMDINSGKIYNLYAYYDEGKTRIKGYWE